MKYLIIILLSVFSFGGTTTDRYKGSFGILGSVGEIVNNVTKKKSSYTISSVVKPKGLAKMLLGNRIEVRVSKGKIVNGIYFPKSYTVTKKRKGIVRVKKSYIFKGNSITKTYIKHDKHGKLTKKEVTKLPFKAHNDLLTLYYNLHTYKHNQKIYSAGLESQNGYATIKRIAPYKMKARFSQESFKNGKGDIQFELAKNGKIAKALLKDVLLGGDAKLELIK